MASPIGCELSVDGSRKDCELAHMAQVPTGGAVGTLCRWGGNLQTRGYELSALGALLRL